VDPNAGAAGFVSVFSTVGVVVELPNPLVVPNVVLGAVAPGTVFLAAEANKPPPIVLVDPNAGAAGFVSVFSIVGVVVELPNPLVVPNVVLGAVAPGTVFLAAEANKPPPIVDVDPNAGTVGFVSGLIVDVLLEDVVEVVEPPNPLVVPNVVLGAVAPGTVFLAAEVNKPPPIVLVDPNADVVLVSVLSTEGAVLEVVEPPNPLVVPNVVLGAVAPGTVFLAAEANKPPPIVLVDPNAGAVGLVSVVSVVTG
jgi:phosphatidylglycerophosphatase A